MDCEEIRLNLLAYLDGEVDENERASIEAHLSRCADCAAELQRLQALQADLWDAVPLGLEQLRLPGPAEERIRANLRRAQARQVSTRRGRESRGWIERLGDLVRPRPRLARQKLARQKLALAKVAIPLFVALCFLVAGLAGLQPAPVRALETIVVAPQTLAPDTDAALRVIVREAGTAAPIADAELNVYLRPTGEPETLLYSGRTGDAGTADVGFAVPDYERDRVDADLVVTIVSPLGKSEVRQKVVVERSFRLLLTSDKPLYQPGQTIHMRALALDAARKLPATDRSATFVVYDPGGKRLFEQVVTTSAYGIAAAETVLAADAPSGAYRLAVQLGDTRSEREITVGRYERPRFVVELDLPRPYYLSGEVVEAEVIARAFDRAPLPGADVTLKAYLHAPERTLLATMLGRTDFLGAYAFRFTLPAQISGDGAHLALEAQVTDRDGHSEWAGRVVPLAVEPLAIDIVAEGGRLRPGVDNRVYLLVTRPDGAPTRARLDVGVGERRHTLQTDAYGLATFDLRPEPGVREVLVQVAATDAQGRTVSRALSLSADRGPAQVLLRLDRATYRVGDTLRAEVLADTDGLVYLDVVHRGRGQTISTHALTLAEGRATLDLDVSPQMAGTLELHAYQVLPDGTLARDARLAVVDAPAALSVDVRIDKAAYRPGDVAQVTVETSVDGAPRQSALGIAVVDESVFALEERAPGFAKLFFLLEKQLLDAAAQPPGVALAELLDPTAVASVQAAQDQAARAAWAKLPIGDLAAARSASSEVQTNVRLQWLGWCLSIVLLILPLGQWIAIVARLRGAGLYATGVRRAALRRAALWVVGLTVVVLAPMTVLMTLLLALIAGEAVSKALLIVLSIAWLAALVVLGVHAWRRREDGTQIVILLVIAHGFLVALLLHVAGRGGDPGPGLALAVTLAFVAALLGWLLLAAGFWVEQRRGTACWLVIGVLLSIALVVLLGTMDTASSLLIRTIGDPQVYVGPAGWLIGCSPKAVIVEREVEKVVEETVVVEKQVEKVVKETVVVEVEKEVTRVVEKEVTKIVAGTPLTEEPVQPTTAVRATPTPLPAGPVTPADTPSPAAQATAAPSAVTETRPPSPPPPLLGQYIPETLYWAPEAITDLAGRLAIDIPLPDTPAAWRLTILASTQQGELGSAETALLVTR